MNFQAEVCFNLMRASNTRHSSIPKALLFLAILQAFLLDFAWAEKQTFESKAFNFTLSYSDSFKEVPASNALNPLTLKAKQGEYPTFNIVVQPGSEVVTQDTLKTLSDQILASYRNSGFLGAKMIESRIVKLRGRSALECRIEYALQGAEYTSLVVFVPTQSRSFILTYIDTKQNFGREIHLGQEIITSVELNDPKPPSEQRANAQNTWFWPILGLLLLVVAAYWLKPRLTSSKKS